MRSDTNRIPEIAPYITAFVLIPILTNCSSIHEKKLASESPKQKNGDVVLPQEGDPAMGGGSPTIRKSFVRQPDNPYTTNNEANDHPLGHFGNCTITCLNESSGNSYPLDADVASREVKRIYFPKGGWVDFSDSSIDENGTGEGTDEQGRS
jgi:hypothetical protein